MKTYQKILIIIVLIALCVLSYISRKTKEDDGALTATTTAASPDDIVIDESTDFYTMNVHIPKEPRDTNNLMKTSMTNTLESKKEEWKTGGALYNEEKALSVQYPDRPKIKYELSMQYDKFVSKDRDTVSYVFKDYEFTGGAHGGTGLVTFTFGPKGIVSIQDVLDFSRENSIALSRLLESKLKPQLGEMYNEDMLTGGLGLAYIKADGSFDKTKSDGFDFISNFEHFVILDEGIKFIFGQYQVAPYAAGMPEVMLSWDELKPFLK